MTHTHPEVEAIVAAFQNRPPLTRNHHAEWLREKLTSLLEAEKGRVRGIVDDLKMKEKAQDIIFNGGKVERQGWNAALKAVEEKV